MAEPAAFLHPDPEVASRDLSARAAAIAQRLATLLETSCSPGSGAPAAVAFLREWAASVAGRRPATEQSMPIDLLVRTFGLTNRECDLLLLAGLAEEHEGLADTFRTLHPRSEPRPMVGLAALVLGDGADDLRPQLRRLLGDGPLMRHGLLQLAGDGPFFERALVPADRLWDALHGHDAWPDRIPRVQVDGPPAGLAGWLDLLPARRAMAALGSGAARTLVVTALDDGVGLSRCAALAKAVGCRLVAGSVAPADRAAVSLVVAHAAARSAVPVLVLRPPASGPQGAAPLDLDGAPGPVLVCAPPGSMQLAGARPVLSVPTAPIRPEDHRAAWRGALPDLAGQAPALAVRHPLDPGVLTGVAADVRSRQALPGGLSGIHEISEVIRNRAGVVLPPGVELTASSTPWERLVLPDEPTAQLRDAVARLENGPLVLDDWGFLEGTQASRGVRLLFTGPPGTGKSLAAKVVGTAAGTDLLAVDVSQVMSKWVGDTEKNLAAIFDAAERTQAVLLLDEADGLFGARTQVSDAQDRYLNLHTAYLLQRLDAFEGLTVLTTNLRQNIDPAFIRRVDFVVEFPLPDEPHRARMWRLHLPARAAVADDIDVAVLARLYPVPGASIRNAALAAAFVAASEGEPIHQWHLVAAMRREYAKVVRPYPGEPPAAATGFAAGEDASSKETP
jgi:hypothetical protein